MASCEVCGEGLENNVCEACSAQSSAHERALHIAWLYRVAQTALMRAREYRREEGKGGARERECLAALTEHRHRIRRLRQGLRGPGLRKADERDLAQERATGT